MIRIIGERWQKRILIVGLTVTAVLTAPLAINAVQAGAEGWVDQLTGVVLIERDRALSAGEAETFDPYWGQLQLVRSLYDRGDHHGTYVAMNRFMDMLEARVNGISPESADAIWDYCYQVTPPAFHDAQRHKEWWDKTVDWDEFFWGVDSTVRGTGTK
jgi:hypothetical protein